MAFNGTGANVTTLNASNISSGTVATARLGSGTANNTTFLRGDSTFAVPASAQGGRGELFTSSGTFTVPAGVTAVKVTVIGGGGGSGATTRVSPSFGARGGGAGGGGMAIEWITGLTPADTVTVTVGAGGAGGVTGTDSGATGGTSSFGAYCSATGGAGTIGLSNALATTGGAGGTGSGGTINISGGAGSRAFSGSGSGGATNFANASSSEFIFECSLTFSFIPGQSFYGRGGSGLSVQAVGNPGVGNGAGAGGGLRSSSGSNAGGAGSGGLVIVEY
jgi:hypothetical protein